MIAPATSNTVAKCVVGISDTLPTNMFAQAGKLGIPGIVFACDTEPVVVTKSPHDWVTLRPRRVELDVWLDVDPRLPSNTCRAQANEPNALALLCYQDAWQALSHQSALPRPRTVVVTDAIARCSSASRW